MRLRLPVVAVFTEGCKTYLHLLPPASSLRFASIVLVSLSIGNTVAPKDMWSGIKINGKAHSITVWFFHGVRRCSTTVQRSVAQTNMAMAWSHWISEIPHSLKIRLKGRTKEFCSPFFPKEAGCQIQILVVPYLLKPIHIDIACSDHNPKDF